jgi:hypothetical protein
MPVSSKKRRLAMRRNGKPEIWRLNKIAWSKLTYLMRHRFHMAPIANMLDHRIRMNQITAAVRDRSKVASIALDRSNAPFICLESFRIY